MAILECSRYFIRSSINKNNDYNLSILRQIRMDMRYVYRPTLFF